MTKAKNFVVIRLVIETIQFGYSEDIDDIDSVKKVIVVPSSVSWRLPKETAEKIQRIAAIEHRSFAEMVRILAEEALQSREFPDIIFT